MALPNKFTNVQPLQPGQNAKVFSATNSFVNRQVFLKIYPIPAGDPRSALREPQLLEQLQHRNLVRIFGADKVGTESLLLEMELVSGGSLQELIDTAVAAGEWPSIHDAVRLVSECAAGLNHLHDNGYVHRDVRPANLLVRGIANREGVVTDLGLASRVNDVGRAFATKHARLYRPPEVWENRGYSRQSDIYQLGIVFFQLLGGGVDHTQGNLPDRQLKERTVALTLFDLSSVGPHVDEGLRRVLRKCVCLENERYTCVPDLIASLSSIKANHADWRYNTRADGFELQREADGATYRVDVQRIGTRCTVSRQKRIGSGLFRRKGKAATIYHNDIGRCRQFRQMLIW